MSMKRRVVLPHPGDKPHNPSDGCSGDDVDAAGVVEALGTCVVDLSAIRSYMGKEALHAGGRTSQGNAVVLGGERVRPQEQRENSRPPLPPLALSSLDAQLITSTDLSSQQSGTPAAGASRACSLPRATTTTSPSMPADEAGRSSPRSATAGTTTSPRSMLQQPFNISFGLASMDADNSASFAAVPTLHAAHASPPGVHRHPSRNQLRALPGMPLAGVAATGSRRHHHNHHHDPFASSALEHAVAAASCGTGCNKRNNVSLQVVPCTVAASSQGGGGDTSSMTGSVTAAIRLLRIPKERLGPTAASTALLADVAETVYRHICSWSDFDRMPDTCEAAGGASVVTRSGSLDGSPSRSSQETLKHRLSATMNEAAPEATTAATDQEALQRPPSSSGFATTAPPQQQPDESTFLHVTHMLSAEQLPPPGSALTVAGASAVFASPLTTEDVGFQHGGDGSTADAAAADGDQSPPHHGGVPAAAAGPFCALPALSVTYEMAPPSASTVGGGGDACLVIAQPFISNGNVLDRYHSWLRHHNPTFVEREVAIRRILRSCLWQLVQLHRRGDVHGSVKATNMFAWSDVKAAAAAWTTSNPTTRTATSDRNNAGATSPGLTVVTTDDGGGGRRRNSHPRSRRGSSKSFRGGTDHSLDWIDDVVLVDGAYHRIQAIVEAKFREHATHAHTMQPHTSGSQPAALFDVTKYDYVLPPECLQRARTQQPTLEDSSIQPSRQQRQHGGDPKTDAVRPTTLQQHHSPFTMAEVAPAANVLTPAADIWGLGLTAIHLADGGFPSWLHRQAKPVPSLSNTTWSHKFASFVQVCVSLQPEHRTTAEALLDDPWFHAVISAPPPSNDNTAEGDVQNVAILQHRDGSSGGPDADGPCGSLQRFANTSFTDALAGSGGGASGGGGATSIMGGGAAAGSQGVGTLGIPLPSSPSSVSRPLRHLFDFTTDGRVFVPQKNYMRTFADMELSCLQYVLATKRTPRPAKPNLQHGGGGEAPRSANTMPLSAVAAGATIEVPGMAASEATMRMRNNASARDTSTESQSGTQCTTTPRNPDASSSHGDRGSGDGADDDGQTPSSRNPLESTRVGGLDSTEATSASPSARRSTVRNEGGTKRFSVTDDMFNDEDDGNGLSLAWAPLPKLPKPNKPPFLAAFLAAIEACRRDLLVDCGFYVASGKHTHPADEVVLTMSGTAPTTAQRREIDLIDHRIAGLVQAFLDLYNVAPICGDHWILSILEGMRKHPATQDIIEPVIRCWGKQQSRRAAAATAMMSPTAAGSQNHNNTNSSSGTPAGVNGGGDQALRTDGASAAAAATKHTATGALFAAGASDALPTDFNNYLFSKWLVLGALTVQERR